MSSAERMAALRERRREAGEPVEDLNKVRERMVAYRARLRETRSKPPPRKRKARGVKDFMTVDGEGCGQDRLGRQHYMLLCAGNEDEQYELYTGKPLSTEECLEFILNLPGDVVLTGFSFGYDSTMILGSLPPTKPEDTPWKPSRRQDILAEKDVWPVPPGSNREPRERKSKYTYWRGFGIEYLPNQYFRVCRLITEKRSSPDGKIVWWATHAKPRTARTIYEGFAFFQKRFAKALTDFGVGTTAERRMIAQNKAERASFRRITRKIRDYCAMECELHARMMETLRTAWAGTGLAPPKTWNGPGKLAAAAHKQHGTPTAEDVEHLAPSGLLMMADAAYYGGRFECPRLGKLPPLWEYDINSAYPAAMLTLPCLEHGRWEYVDGEAIRRAHADPDKLYVAQLHYKHEPRHGCRGMCGLPHRRSGREDGGSPHYAGTIAWGLEGRGTYWSPEVRSAEAVGARFRFGSGWVYHKQCDCQPFSWIVPLYKERLRLGAQTVGYMLKLVINSLYGKLVQQIGDGPYRNLVWGGLITAITRAKLNAAVAQKPEAICMIATDGIYSLEPLDLPISKELGEWSVKRREHGLFIAQPGLYWEPIGTRRPAKKTRGFGAGWLTWHRRKRFETVWGRYAEAEPQSKMAIARPVVDVALRLFIGISLAEARGDSTLAGRWVDDVKAISFDWHGKRGRLRWCEGPHIHTHPLAGGADWQSASYEAEPNLVALADAEGWEFEEQPDRMAWMDDEG